MKKSTCLWMVALALVLACPRSGVAQQLAQLTSHTVVKEVPNATAALFAQWQHPRYAAAVVELPGLNHAELEVLRLCNLARMNPPLFAQTYLATYGADQPDYWQQSLANTLAETAPMQPLVGVSGLCKSAAVLAYHMGGEGDVFYNGNEAGMFYDRIHRYYPGPRTFATNFVAGSNEPIEIALSLLLSEGDSTFSNRTNLLSPHLDRVGIAIRPHRVLCANTVIDFAVAPVAVATQSFRPMPQNYRGPKHRPNPDVECPPGTKVRVRKPRRSWLF